MDGEQYEFDLTQRYLYVPIRKEIPAFYSQDDSTYLKPDVGMYELEQHVNHVIFDQPFFEYHLVYRGLRT